MTLVFRLMQKKCREQNIALYAAFIDITKAFDTVNHEGLWKFLVPLGCPPKFFTILRELHDDKLGQVKLSGNLSNSFHVSNGFKEGCILAPTLFSIFFSMMITQAKNNIEDGIYVRF